jgi:putative ABC transport system permease protein
MRRFFLKDMAYRRMRVVLTALGIAVLSMLILLFGGIMYGLRWQAQRYVTWTGADLWISRERSGGVFVGFSLVNPEQVQTAAQFIGGRLIDPIAGVSPVIFAHARPTIRRNGVVTEVKAVVVGYQPGKLGGPTRTHLARGRLFVASAGEYAPEQQVEMECVVADSMGVEIGETIDVGGHDLKVVGIIDNMVFVFDTPIIFMDVRTAQAVVLMNAIYVNTLIVKTAEGQDPADVAEMYNDPQRGIRRFEVDTHTSEETVGNILRNFVDEPMRGVQFLRVMLWLATAIVVGMITYVTTMEKTQEIGVMKAIGARNGYVLRLILWQVGITSVVGVALGLGLAMAAIPAFPITVVLNPTEAVVVCLLSVMVCVVGGLVAARRALQVDPMVAFRGEL